MKIWAQNIQTILILRSNHPKQKMNKQPNIGLIRKLKLCKNPDDKTIRPRIYNLSVEKDREGLENLIKSVPGLTVQDRIGEQLKELFKIRYPKKDYKDSDLEVILQEWCWNNDIDNYGVWVFYPWKSLLIHIVEEDEFIELRTSRNMYKITPNEKSSLSEKVVGVIGLSVGQSVSLTMAIERTFGTLRIADFDTLELTNLNRIRRGIDSLGLLKTTMVAREIAEIDPFLKVEVFEQGINKDNINDFLMSNGKMDLLIEECDSLDIKILARLEARKRGIPVLMDTSDRGMIDIERFDLEPERKIFHGKIDIDDPAKLQGLPYEEKIPFILELIGAKKMSPRLKSSMIEVGESITTWPQLASDVTLGGAITTKIARQILLGENVVSGRFYTEKDDEWIEREEEEKLINKDGNKIFDFEAVVEKNEISNLGEPLGREIIQALKNAALLAPSAGNVQPWKIFIKQSQFFLFLDPSRIGFFGDFEYQASLSSVGALIRNMELEAGKFGLKLNSLFHKKIQENYLVAQISFSMAEVKLNELSKFIESRHTNRYKYEEIKIPEEFNKELKSLLKEYPDLGIHFISDKRKIKELAICIGKADVQRIVNKAGHKGFFSEIRWNDEMARRTGDGIDIDTVDITAGERAGFEIAKDWNAVKLLSQLNLGSAFGALSKEVLESSSAVILISGVDFSSERMIQGGKLMQEIWLLLTKYGFATQPLLSSCLFYNMRNYGGDEVVGQSLKQTLDEIEPSYFEIFPKLKKSDSQLFLFRIGKSTDKIKLSYRRNQESVFFELDD